ncbi:hypothetical protein [Caulobacter sp. Root1472]|uniref:hypothetical protein n=1 Tax=Caulobacter sp. Root1472 TaxID=1736470 RepID=UPI0012DBF7E6|nr:hypothetical protein [Caulobacter sp. Root1472]
MNDHSSDYRHDFFIHSPGPRPPFGSVVDHVYGPAANVDTDGDSDPASSTEWTWLYMQLRPRQGEPVVEVTMIDEMGSVLRVASDDLALATRTAEFLALQTGGALGRRSAPAEIR